MRKLDLIVIIIAMCIIWGTAFMKLDPHTRGPISFVVFGIFHIISNGWLSQRYSKNWILFDPQISPKGAKIIGAIFIVIGALWYFCK